MSFMVRQRGSGDFADTHSLDLEALRRANSSFLSSQFLALSRLDCLAFFVSSKVHPTILELLLFEETVARTQPVLPSFESRRVRYKCLLHKSKRVTQPKGLLR